MSEMEYSRFPAGNINEYPAMIHQVSEMQAAEES
jgi:hypothetical protein